MDIKKIHHHHQTPAAESARRARAAEASAQKQGAPEPSVDRVTVSAKAQAFQATRQAALDVPEVRDDRVAEVSGQLKSGALQPDPNRIAKAMLGSGILE